MPQMRFTGGPSLAKGKARVAVAMSQLISHLARAAQAKHVNCQVLVEILWRTRVMLHKILLDTWDIMRYISHK